MKLSDLKTLIDEIEAEVGGDEDVEDILGVQPEYPFEHKIAGLTVTGNERGEKRIAILDGGQIGYAQGDLFSNMFRL